MKVLVLNVGSSSMKFTFYSMTNEIVLAKGQVERIGSKAPNLTFKRPDGFVKERETSIKDHSDAIAEVCAELTNPEYGVIKDMSEVQAFGHRVLHGGEEVTAPVLITEEIKTIIRKCIPLGPLHNPANLAGIEACEKACPGVPNVGVFDTEFHQSMTPDAYLYALPYDFYKKYGIRKYGFHGTSHRYVTLATAKFLKKDLNDLNIITCHLGNGCSVAAIKNGKVIDTSMGLTPLEGLMMGTRSGDIDPAAVLRLVELGNTAQEVDKILNKESGLYGVGGINSGDMRDMLNAANSGNEQAELAINMFVRRVVKYIAAYYVLVGGAEAISFTGGIGEYSMEIRKKVVDSLSALDIYLDEAENKGCFGKRGVISTENSKWKALVMPTDEELMIARSVMNIVKK